MNKKKIGINTVKKNKIDIERIMEGGIENFYVYYDFEKKYFENSFKDIKPLACKILDQEIKAGVWLLDWPFCALNNVCHDHVHHLTTTAKGEKKPVCKSCKYFKICNGFPVGYFDRFGDSELEPILDLPVEIMLEIESKCNFHCDFCYNHNSFAKNHRNVKRISTKDLKKVINNIKENRINIVRFTGGEPMLRNDIFELMCYSKEIGLELRLNTNCSLVNQKNVVKFKNILDNVLIPVESCFDGKEVEITGYKDSLKSKVNAIYFFSEINVPTIRVGTVITKHFLDNIDAITDFVLKLPIHEWEFYRPVSSAVKSDFDVFSLEKIVDHILLIRQKTDKRISIANAIPFCALANLNLLNSISSGALYEDGHSRMVLDPRGFFKPHYFIEKNLGDASDIMGAWNSEYMKRQRSLKNLPNECKQCNFRYKCRGGSRHEALLFNKDICAPDPLANFNNLK